MKISSQGLLDAQALADKICIKKTGFPWTELCSVSVRSYISNSELTDINKIVELAVEDMLMKCHKGDYFDKAMTTSYKRGKYTEGE
jgi:hypothetical protein